MNEEKSENSQKMVMGISAVAVVAIVGLLVYFLRASDPAARGPIPYKKFDYGAHMAAQQRDFNREPAPASGTSQGSQSTPH